MPNMEPYRTKLASKQLWTHLAATSILKVKDPKSDGFPS